MKRCLCGWSLVFAFAMTACQLPEEPSQSRVSSEIVATNILMSGERLLPDESISLGPTKLIYQRDNNLVLYQGTVPLWSSRTDRIPPGHFDMQTDCNAVVYNWRGQANWSSRTDGRGTSCVAKVIEGDWFICSGTTRVFSARGTGDCGGGTPYTCREPAGAVPLPGIENYHVRIDPSSLYVCDTLLGWEGHFAWPQPPPAEINRECIGACGAGCSPNTCVHQSVGGYIPINGGLACRDVQYDCYASDCCWYHDLCGRLFPTSLFTNPFCHALGTIYGCAPCIGNGFVGCSLIPPTYTRTFVHPYTDREDCICTDRPGDCFDDCSGSCWFGCDINFDCFDDCTGVYVCGFPFCPDGCLGLCGGFGWCANGFDTSGAGRTEEPPPDLAVQIGDETVVWRSAELAAIAARLKDVAAISAAERDSLGDRPGWSLRDIVHRKLGNAARVIAVIDEDGNRVELDGTAWYGTDTTPILRVNRRGQLRFHWVGTRNRMPGAKGVQGIEVELSGRQ